jgi:hypothetical protein
MDYNYVKDYNKIVGYTNGIMSTNQFEEFCKFVSEQPFIKDCMRALIKLKVYSVSDSDAMLGALKSGYSWVFERYDSAVSDDYIYLFRILAKALEGYVGKDKSAFVYVKEGSHDYLVTDLKDLITEKDDGTGLLKVKLSYKVVSLDKFIKEV